MSTDVNATLAERGSRYGKFIDHATATQSLKNVVKYWISQKKEPLEPDQEEALDMIMHKVGRILTGDHNYADSWHDIAGYASLVDQRLQGNVK